MNKYRIESSRLKGYDYSMPGAYFITIITKNRKCYFGSVEKDRVVLNGSGKIAHNFWGDIPKHFTYVTSDEYVVMPNHIHGIIFLTDSIGIKRQPIGVIINQFKRICTIKIRKYDFNFSWHPRFHDHIIRNNESLNRIRQYIKENPKNKFS